MLNAERSSPNAKGAKQAVYRQAVIPNVRGTSVKPGMYLIYTGLTVTTSRAGVQP